ncbi:MAG: hypothetical protein FJ126_08260 [Deltaproteobacteria bacterium]|nr:hypothetical protein [Deltaproteobacteria bacterium]
MNKNSPALALILLMAALAAVSVICPAQSQVPPGGGWESWTFGNWGPYRETMRFEREEAVAKHNYCPTGGCVLRVERVDITPFRARKGDTLTLTTTYTLLTPEMVAIPVTFSREIFYQGKSLGKVKDIDARNKNGTFNREITFTLPQNSPVGDYTLVTKVSTGFGEDMKSVRFLVE